MACLLRHEMLDKHCFSSGNLYIVVLNQRTMSTYVYFSPGGSEIIILGIYLAIILFLYFLIMGVKAFFQELNK